jgi:uncharacterized protein YidB (DUF937 family)
VTVRERFFPERTIKMSLLDLVGQFFAGGQQGSNATLLSTVLQMVNNHPGGLPGLVSSFEQQGLGGAVSSWVGTGANEPIAPQQVQNAVGVGRIQDVAAKLGISNEEASAKIAQLLPGIIDHLTPNGQMPASGSNILEMGEGLLKDFMKSKDQQ